MSIKSVTVQDVARRAGVSTATVSRALSTPEKLSEATRLAVLDAVRETGYHVNQSARNLRKQQAGAILVLVPDLENPFFSKILSGISAGFAGSGLSVLVTDSMAEKTVGPAIRNYFLDGRIDGLICLDGRLTPEDLEQLDQSGHARRIVFACEWVPDAPYPSIRSDNAEGAAKAIRHFHALGHRKIGHITGPQGNVLTALRHQGVMDTLAELDLPSCEDWILHGDFSLASGRDAAQRILAMQTPPTAVFCASDMMAMGLISGLETAGISVPHDISVIGFDDIEMAAFSIPALTTVRQDRRALGTKAAEILLHQITTGTPVASDHVSLMPVDLIHRDSTAAPKRS